MDVPQTPGKRRRETNAPRITYHAASRTFDRLFKEESLDETKDVVRRKLGLSESSNIRLAQVRGEYTVDLEDEDDFDAFYAIAHLKMAVEVQVTTEEISLPPASSSQSLTVSNQNSMLPPDNNDVLSSLSIVHTGDDARISRKVAFLDPSPDSQNVPRKKRRPTLISSSDSTFLENSSPDSTVLVLSPRDTTDTLEHQPELAARPKRKNKNAGGASESPGVEIIPRFNNGSVAQNADELQDVIKPKPKKKAKHVSGVETGSTSSASKSSDKVNDSAPINSRPSKKPPKKNNETAVNAFSQQLAQTITEGHLASAEGEGVSLDAGAPPRKRVKRRNSVAGQNTKTTALERLSNGRTKPVKGDRPSEMTEQYKVIESPPINITGTTRSKRKKKDANEVERVLTPAEIETVKGDIGQFIASLTAGESAAKPASRTQKPATSSEILATAKNKERTNSSTPHEVGADVLSSAKKLSGLTETSDDDDDGDGLELSKPNSVAQPSPTPGTLDNIDSSIYLDELIRGPVPQRLTLANVLPFAIASSRKRKAVVLEEDPVVKPKSIRHSFYAKATAWPDSDSDVAGYESVSDTVETVPNILPSINQPPALEISKNLIAPSATAESEAEATVVPAATPSPGQVSPVKTAVNETIMEASSEMPRPVTPMNEPISAVPNTQNTQQPSLPYDVPDEHDPIEPIIPSPRSHSSIENALTTTGIVRHTKSRTYPKPEVILSRRSNSKSQPLSKHEVDVRQSVVRLTRARSKPEVELQTTPGSVLPRSPTSPPSPRRLRSATQSVRVTSTIGSLARQIPASIRASRSQSVENVWTILPALPSPPVDVESSHGTDELHTSPNGGRVSPAVQYVADPEAPLFITSASQLDFPYSQFQDLNADTDNRAEEAPGGTDRLQEDSEEEDEVQETITPRVTRRDSTAYRGLSQISAPSKFFTGFKPSTIASSTPNNRKEDMYGPLSQAYDDDASDSGSESEEEKSHIPRARRAGNKR